MTTTADSAQPGTSDVLGDLMAECREDALGVEAREMLSVLDRKLFSEATLPLTVGRYHDLERIGEGAMGIVYRARDVVLRRSVALKVLRTGISDVHEIRREGQALAQLDHPNVVRVLDLGVHDTVHFVAMELVVGQTAAEWLRQTRPPWREVVAVFCDAAAGLAAAHAAGIVHADVKPSNILVGQDGRARVTDFGLSMTERAASTQPDVDVPASGHIAAPRGGTPGYAPPEQLREGAPVDHRADQFALAASLHQALTGTLPFETTSAASFESAVREGPARAIDGIPSSIAPILRRALAATPSDRYPDIRTFMHALRRASQRRPWTKIAWAAAATALLAAGAWIAVGGEGEAPCQRAETLAEPWDDAARQRAAVAFTTLDRAYAQHSYARVDAVLLGFQTQWKAAYRAICTAGPGQDDARFDARLSCLGRSLAELSAVAALLGDADATTVAHADEAVSGLPTPSTCWDAEPAAPDAPRLSVRDRAAYTELVERNASVGALLRVGATEEAGILLRGDPPTLPGMAGAIAHHHALRGRLALERGEPEESERWLTRAYFGAAAVGDDRLSALTAAQLASLHRDTVLRRQDGERWRRHAEASMRRRATDDPDTALTLTALAEFSRARGDLDGAAQQLTRARDILQAAPAADLPRMARVLTDLGAVQFDRGDPQTALTTWADAVAMLEDALGTDHPRLFGPLHNLATAHLELAQPQRARALFERSLALTIGSLGPDHVQRATVENGLGNVCIAQRDDACAQAHFERALQLMTKTLGPDDPKTVHPRANLGQIHTRAQQYGHARRAFAAALRILGESDDGDSVAVARLQISTGYNEEQAGAPEQAVKHYRAGLEILERQLGPEHPDVATALSNLGAVTLDLGDAEGALEPLHRVVMIRVAAFGPNHPAVAYARVAYASALASAGDMTEAIVELRHAVQIHKDSGAIPTVVAEAELRLAEVLLADGQRSAALRTARRARGRCDDKPAVDPHFGDPTAVGPRIDRFVDSVAPS